MVPKESSFIPNPLDNKIDSCFLLLLYVTPGETSFVIPQQRMLVMTIDSTTKK